MIRGSEDLLEDLKLETDAAAVADRIELPEEERRVLALLVGPTLPDIVAAGIGCGIPETVGVLMRLELRGLVRGVGGRYEPTLKGSAASG
jgi:predicted Rossmann fold nucleotide-binding protein DprA/Smf involved in DNA uptake